MDAARCLWRVGMVAVVAVGMARAASACEPGQNGPCQGGVMLCCPGAYCRKPMPCLPCPEVSCCPDNYCRKPLPCPPCPEVSYCPDNYCRKPMPRLCWPARPVKCCCCRAAAPQN